MKRRTFLSGLGALASGQAEASLLGTRGAASARGFGFGYKASGGNKNINFTWSPTNLASTVNLSNLNLDARNSISGSSGAAFGTLGKSSGKWYFEAKLINTPDSSNDDSVSLGVSSLTPNNSTFSDFAYHGSGTSAWVLASNASNAAYATYSNGTSLGSNSPLTAINDVIGVALDIGAGTVNFYVNGTIVTYNVTGLSAGTYYPVFGSYSTGTTVKFSLQSTVANLPSGYNAWA